MKEIIHGDCLDVMQGMDSETVDLIVTDPPYFNVKSEGWDRQWANFGEFMEWLDVRVGEMVRLL